MDFDDLTAFLAVADELHFGRAAQRLHMAQPPLSRTIKRLEEELGTSLFERTTRSVRLTSAGSALISPARQALRYLDNAKRSVRAAARGEAGHVRVGFSGPSSHPLIRALSRHVRKHHPSIELALVSMTSGRSALSAVIDGELDLALARWTTPPPGIASRVVSEERYVLVVPDDHPLAGRACVAMSDCKDEPFVALPDDPGSTIREAFLHSAQSAGYSPRIIQTAPDTWTAIALVAAGVGLTFSVDTAVGDATRHGVATVNVKEHSQPVSLHLAWRRTDENPALRTVIRASCHPLPSPSKQV